MRQSIEMYNGKVWGYEVSNHGKENGYLDYATLAKMVGDCIPNNIVRAETMMMEWELINGDFDRDIMHEFIIGKDGYRVLSMYTDEMVFYCDQLDLYIWAVDHTGTSWKYVLTDIELIEEE